MSGSLHDILAFLNDHWPDAKGFFDSVFFIALVSSLAGAFAGTFAGARAAQRMADKTRNRDELLKEIRTTNAAATLAFAICSTLLSAKKQHIKSLKETFDQDKASTIEALKQQQAGTGGAVNFTADVRTLPTLDVPVSLLQTQIFERLSLHGRPILLATTLAQAVDALNLAIVKRNQLIDSFKTGSLPGPQALALYFGFPFGGRVSQDYSDTIGAIYRQTDDGIFFSSQLCGDLTRHGDQLAALFKRRFGRGAPRIHKPDFSKAAGADLMPNESDYADQMGMFGKRQD